MIKSMTAFGRARYESESKNITIELKSVNSRFFDCNVKMPRAYIFLEDRIKNYVQKNAIGRGKVDVFLTIENLKTDNVSVGIDEGYARSYISALHTLRDTFGLADDISVMSVARNQDVFSYERAEEDLEAEWETIRSVLDEAIAGFVTMRSVEGAKAESDIKAKIELVRSYADEVEEISKTDTVGYRDKLEAKLRAILDDEKITPDALEFPSEDRKHIGLEIHSGQNRVVRRMFEKVGYKVTKLDRVSFAGLTKKNVARGKYRFLTPKEVAMLQMGAFE